MSPPIRNVAASVYARLLNRARDRREDFQFILHRYAAERLLYRLGSCSQRERYVLKGAMLFALWGRSLWSALADRQSFAGTWTPSGPWTIVTREEPQA